MNPENFNRGDVVVCIDDTLRGLRKWQLYVVKFVEDDFTGHVYLHLDHGTPCSCRPERFVKIGKL